MRIRKQVDELNAGDFAAHPVWEFALDEEGEEGQDETTVRPFDSKGPLDPSEGMFVVAAAFILADGSSGVGFLTPQPREMQTPAYLQPVLLSPAGQVALWCGVLKPGEADLASAYARLNRSAASVFPVRFMSAVPLTTGSLEGTINGFGYLESVHVATPSYVR
jgi:hypothetical protein